MNKAFQDMAERMVTLIRVMYIYLDEFENKRECPFFSELKGMTMALETMGIDYELEYNDEIKISAVIVNGYKAIV